MKVLLFLASLFFFSIANVYSIETETDYQTIQLTGSRSDDVLNLETFIDSRGSSHTVKANVSFLTNHIPNENLDITLEGRLYRDRLTVSAFNNSLNEYLVFSEKSETRSRSRNETLIESTENLSIISAREYFNHINGPKRIFSHYSSLIQFSMPKVYDVNDSYFALTINTPFGLIYRSELSRFDYTMTQHGDQTILSIYLERLLGANYYRFRGSNIAVDLSTQIRPTKKILNTSQFSGHRFIGNTRFFTVLY